MADLKRVVCVEDDPGIIDLVKMILVRRGFEVIGVVGGQEAVQTIEHEKPDVVLLDLMMPGVDGWEVYHQMQANEALKDIPVIIITAKAQSIDKVLALHIAKVDDYITKPFVPQELIDSIEKVLARTPQ